jgi:23S rRNA maturation-related 3'-5' exoribonuclease YhaM
MGRYYTGDIEGKFWFALQSSNAATRFGGIETEPAYLDYYFDEDQLEEVEAEIKNIEKSLGDKVKILETFFEKNNGYTDISINKLGVSMNELRDYADLKLGIKIRDCIKESGQCSFQAEL